MFNISGSLVDTVNLTNPGYASVSLIRASDSILQGFTRANEEGKFELAVPASGRYLLLTSHPSFATLIDVVDVVDSHTNMGIISLMSRKQLLAEVVITDSRAIIMKGDTVEYNADSFQTRAFDNVDELLKKLPGIEVDRNGKIKAYGKEVKKMLVDGEEFFSDDPAVVSQTLRAASVEKVQVFDKKSDQAAFTGVDDGELMKTINLQLKDNAKKGYFGKVTAGGGLPNYWENQAMMNSFKKKRKISAFGIMSNTSTNGLGWSDRNKYGGSNSSFFNDEDGGGMIIVQSDDSDEDSWNGQYNGQGLPKTWTGGAHYSNKWKGDSLGFNGSYRFAKAVVEGVNNSRTRYILPDTQYVNTDKSSSTKVNNKQSITTISDYQIDTTSSLKITLGGNYNTGKRNDNSVSETVTMIGGLLNRNNNNQEFESEDKTVNIDLLYRKRFKKKGRSISAGLGGSWRDKANNGSLYSDFNLYAIDSAYTINQRKDNSSNALIGKAKVSYTEPLSKVANLELNYTFALNNNDAKNNSFDRIKSGAEDVEVFNPLFSSHYVFNAVQNQAGANMRFDLKKFKFGFGGNIANTDFKQEDKLLDTTYKYSYLNFFPKVNFRFNKSQSTSFSFWYNGQTRQPSIAELQPFRNNTDPMNVAIGNPNLKQQFSHDFRLDYNSYKMLVGRNIYGGATFSVIQDAISQVQNVDESGRRTFQAVNVDGNFNGFLYVDYGRKIYKDLTASAGVNGGFTRAKNFTNGQLNINNNLSIAPNLSIYYYKDTTFNFSYRFNPRFTSNTASIRKDIRTQYWSYFQELDGSVNLPLKITVGTTIDWNIRQRVDPNDRNNNVFRWNAYVSKAFLKDRSLVAKVFAYDILNQNVGYTRHESADYISENSYNTITRYLMFSLTWNFTKTGGDAPQGDGIIIAE